MQIMTAKEAKNSFGVLIDTSQREPVVVTKRERPVGVFLSIQDIKAIPELRDSLLAKLNELQKPSNPLLDMMGANKAHPCFVSPEAADSFIDKLRDEWTS